MSEDKKISPKQAAIAVIKKFGELLIKADAEGKASLLKAEKISKEDSMGMMDKEKSKKDLKKDDVPPTGTINSQIGFPFGKSSENPDEKEDAELGEKVEHDVEEHMEDNKEAEQKEGHEMAKGDHIKGHIKLAHFIGHMEGKKKAKIMPDSGNSQEQPKEIKEMDKAEEDRSKMSGKSGMIRIDTESNQNQKGVGQVGHKGSSGGISEAGSYLRDYGSDPSKQKTSYGKEKAGHVKEIHSNIIADQKAMKKPKLPK